MKFELLTLEGLAFLLRWSHFLAGITWIGVLWYFNFIQGAYFKEIDPGQKKRATQTLVPRALWWFRWGAMFTIITGLSILALRGHQHGIAYWATAWGVTIWTGGIIGIFMWFNVWFIIWPAQKVAIAAANDTPIAGQDAAARGRRAFLASRTNTLFSIPMLFFMAAASHLPIPVDPSQILTWAIVAGVIVLLVEANALTATTGITTQPIETVRGVITSGLVLTLVLYVLYEVVVRQKMAAAMLIQ